MKAGAGNDLTGRAMQLSRMSTRKLHDLPLLHPRPASASVRRLDDEMPQRISGSAPVAQLDRAPDYESGG